MSTRHSSEVDRRRFLGFLVAAPTLTMAARFTLDGVLAPHASAAGVSPPEPADHYDHTDLVMDSGRPFAYDLLIEITEANRVRFEVPRLEFGQGITTAAAMMLADNLDARLEDIDVSLSPAEVKRQAAQLTGGSLSVRSLWDPIRVLSAQLRARLITAGAEALGVDANTVHTDATHVVATDGRRVPYGAVAKAAAQVKVPAVAPVPKRLDQLQVIGRPQGRVDAREIVTGQRRYAMDVPVPGAVPTVLALPATLGATVVSVDATDALAMPGVVAVAEIPGLPELGIGPGVAVAATTFGQAIRARKRLRVQWSAGPMDHMSDREVSELLHSLLDPVAAPESADGLDAYFEWPYVSHAPMETNDAVADVRPDRAELWMGSQGPVLALQQVAQMLGLKDEQVTLHVVPAGGGFGRRVWTELAVQAAQASQKIGRPVKLMYTREDDLRHGRARPASVHHVRATVANGEVQTFEHRMAGAQLDFRHGFGEAISAMGGERNPTGVAQTVFHLSQRVPYKVGATSLSLREQALAVPTSAWRVIYSGTVATVNEIVIDELARLLGRDEYEFRRQTLEDDRARAVLDVVARKGQWGKPMAPGTAQGLGMHQEYKSVAAFLMECDARGPEPHITKVTVAVDPGRVVNPKGLEAQFVGVTMDAISVVFSVGLHVDGGRIREGGLQDFRWTRMHQSPLEVDVHILPPTRDEPGGAGELGVPAACAAAANAWARATGKHPRRFPLNEHGA
jgi:isoquinoline 1-oxidoreductase beta subunit